MSEGAVHYIVWPGGKMDCFSDQVLSCLNMLAIEHGDAVREVSRDEYVEHGKEEPPETDQRDIFAG